MGGQEWEKSGEEKRTERGGVGWKRKKEKEMGRYGRKTAEIL